MSLVVVAGAKGAAGVTTAATALAAVWPSPAVLADCDPAGGDVALRLRARDGGWLAGDRGVVGLAAAARTRPGPLDVAGQLQTAVGGLAVLAGVDSPAQAARIGGLWPVIAAALAAVPGTDVVADCGRLLPGLPSEQLLAYADLLLLVAHPTVESLAHLRHAVDAVMAMQDVAPARLHVAVIGNGRAGRGVEQVRDALAGVTPAGAGFTALAHDPAAAAGLAGTPTRGLDRSALVASARRLAGELYTRLHAELAPAGEPAGPTAPSAAGGAAVEPAAPAPVEVG